jgi:hypothetical protein
MDKETGGPAFPGAMDRHHSEGMTLRDYFAAQALIGICANQDNRAFIGAVPFASAAYVLADAMLKAREE